MNPNDMQKILRHMFMQSIMQCEVENYFTQKFESPDDLHRLEHDPNIKTAITERDMLLLHVDIALDSGDEDAFMRLTKELKNLESVDV